MIQQQQQQQQQHQLFPVCFIARQVLMKSDLKVKNFLQDVFVCLC